MNLALDQVTTMGWLFAPAAVLLGALHGLEPGHSKSMMAAFIVAVKGTVGQAAVLALCATLSHTAVVWLIALAGVTFGQRWTSEANEPYFQMISAAVIIAIALWMLWRTWEAQHPKAHGHHHHHYGHDHNHGHSHDHDHSAGAPIDAHAKAHEAEIESKYAGRTVTMGQVAVFGLTGGLMPCSAAVTVLLVCLQIHRIWLGMALVACFSIGLAFTLLAFGVGAAWAMRHVHRRWPGLDVWTRRARYLSSLVVIALGVSLAVQGWTSLGAA